LIFLLFADVRVEEELAAIYIDDTLPSFELLNDRNVGAGM
jgi:hypothetical protein